MAIEHQGVNMSKQSSPASGSPSLGIGGPDYLEKIINSIADPIFVKDRAHRWVFLNDAFCDFIGHSRQELLGKSDYDFFPKKQADVFWARDEVVFKTGREDVNEEYITDASGRTHTIVTKKTLYTNKPGAEFIVGVIRDITQRKQIEEAWQASEHRLKTLMENIPGVIYRCLNDTHWSMEYISAGIRDLSGFDPSDFIHNQVRSYASIIHPDDRQNVYQIIQKSIRKKLPFSLEYRIVDKEGGIRWVYEKGQAVFAGRNELQFLDGAIFDITTLKDLEERLRSLSLIDDLTQLHNRRSFFMLADHEIKMAKRRNNSLALIFIDMDNMKWINDTQGHREGDRALKTLAGILKRFFRESDVVARYGGDEFVILAVGVNKDNSAILTNRLKNRIKKLNARQKRRYQLSISMGVNYCSPDRLTTIEEMIKKADRLMYKDKQSKQEIKFLH